MAERFHDNQRVAHWNYGRGWIVCSGPEEGEVPWEWEHDWKSIALVEFIETAMPDGRCPRIWVLHEDLEPFEGV